MDLNAFLSSRRNQLKILVITVGLIAACFVFRSSTNVAQGTFKRMSRDEVASAIVKAQKEVSRLVVQEVDVRDIVYMVYRPSFMSRINSYAKYANLYGWIDLVKRKVQSRPDNAQAGQTLATVWTNQTTIASYVDLTTADIQYISGGDGMMDRITVTVGFPKIDEEELCDSLGSLGLDPISPEINDIRLYDKLENVVKKYVRDNLHVLSQDKTLFDDGAQRAAVCAIRSFYRRALPGIDVRVRFKSVIADMEPEKGSVQ